MFFEAWPVLAFLKQGLYWLFLSMACTGFFNAWPVLAFLKQGLY